MKRFRSSAAAAVALLAVGCPQASHPGNWDEATVEAKLQDKMDLTSLDLSPTADGFEGTGVYPDGEETIVTVKQSGTRLDYTGRGNRGSNEDGEYVTD